MRTAGPQQAPELQAIVALEPLHQASPSAGDVTAIAQVCGIRKVPTLATMPPEAASVTRIE
jgi:hypothetical protein